MDPKIVSSLKQDFGAFAFLNLLTIITLFNVGITTGDKVASVFHILFGLMAIYFIFTITNLFPKNQGFVKGFVWVTLIFTIAQILWVSINLVWTIVFLIAPIYVLIKLNKASKSLQATIPLPPVAQ